MDKIYQKKNLDIKNLVKRGLGGFTLIELLVVVLIIGILAAIALPQYTKAVEKSRAAEAMVILRSIAEANRRYYMAAAEYAPDLSALDIEVPGTDTTYQGQKRKETKYFSYGVHIVGDTTQVLAVANRLPMLTAYYLSIRPQSNSIYCYGYSDEGTEKCKALSGGVQEGSFYVIN